VYNLCYTRVLAKAALSKGKDSREVALRRIDSLRLLAIGIGSLHVHANIDRDRYDSVALDSLV
jgi:hypothetical protein